MADNMAELPECVRVDVIAQLFGVTARRILQLTQDGVLPTTTKPGGRKAKSYDLVATVQRYTKYLSDKANGRNEKDSESKLKEQKLKAEVKLKESQAELHELKTDITMGKYLTVEEVKLDYGKFLTNFKKMALAIPGRVSGIISTSCDPVRAREIENDLNNEITQMLTAFVNAAKEAGDG